MNTANIDEYEKLQNLSNLGRVSRPGFQDSIYQDLSGLYFYSYVSVFGSVAGH